MPNFYKYTDRMKRLNKAPTFHNYIGITPDHWTDGAYDECINPWYPTADRGSLCLDVSDSFDLMTLKRAHYVLTGNIRNITDLLVDIKQAFPYARTFKTETSGVQLGGMKPTKDFVNYSIRYGIPSTF